MSRQEEDIWAQKAALRRHFRSLLAAMAAADRAEENQRICASLRASGPWRRAGTVMVYAPTGHEPDITALAVEAIGAGRHVCVPAIDWESGTMAASVIGDWNTDLIAGAHGVREPRMGLQTVEPEELDVVLVPGLAFDRSGGRLGRGAGFFDRYLSRLTGRTAVVGVCFGCQLVGRVPRDSKDLAVGWLATATSVAQAGT
ncbi:MAG: 5-formyltetrahydrofolate cyclo-ligase [Phycisphaerales bacterium]